MSSEKNSTPVFEWQPYAKWRLSELNNALFSWAFSNSISQSVQLCGSFIAYIKVECLEVHPLFSVTVFNWLKSSSISLQDCENRSIKKNILDVAQMHRSVRKVRSSQINLKTLDKFFYYFIFREVCHTQSVISPVFLNQNFSFKLQNKLKHSCYKFYRAGV